MAIFQHILITISGQGRSQQIHEIDKQEIPAAFKFDAPAAEKKKKKFRWRHTLKHVAWLTFSGVILGVIAIVCGIFDGQYAPGWKQSTINAIVAWLGKLALLGIAIPLAEVMGQLKWTYFRSKDCRKMNDLDLMDGASRNVVGALNWMFRLRNG